MKKEELLNDLYKLKRTTFKNPLSSFLDYETVSLTDVIALVERLNEPEKVFIPGFVADEFDYNKNPYWEVDEAKIVTHILRCAFGDEAKPSEFLDWVRENPEDYVMAVRNGYEIEKEPLYYVKLPNTNSEDEYLYLAQGSSSGGHWFNSKLELIEYDTNTCQHQFTEAEIKSIDSRYWQFAQPVEEEEE